jgi:hypothetical protein
LKELLDFAENYLEAHEESCEKGCNGASKLKQEQTTSMTKQNDTGKISADLNGVGDWKKKGGCYICDGPHRMKDCPTQRGLRETGRQLNVILVEGITKLHSVTRRKVVITRQVQ